MQTNCYTIAAASAVAGAAAQYVISTYLWPNRHRLYTWVFAYRNHKQLGEPCKTDLVLNRDGYSLGYSFDKKCALWVSAIISKRSIGIDMERSDKFYADPDIPEDYRLKPDDFKNTGYDKGHLAPNSAIDFSRKSNDQTFAMSNIALQDPKLNRQSWKSLEGLIEDWARTKGKLCFITGPVYNKRPEKVNGVPLPKSFYKVIYSFKHERCIGFIIPNKDIPAHDLWKYAMSVAEVEKETEYRFFDQLNKADQKIKKELDLEWWKEGH
jgi:endonuclease G